MTIFSVGEMVSRVKKLSRTRFENIITERLVPCDLDLAVGPPRNLDDKVDDLLIRLVRIKRDVVPE